MMFGFTGKDPLENAINPNEAWKTATGLDKIPTASLIAELESRRPCDKCKFDNGGSHNGACACIWENPFRFEYDQFTEATK